MLRDKVFGLVFRIEFYPENELDEQIRTISKLIEPILMVVMALLVGFIVIAVLMPIYAIVSDVQS